MVVCQYNMPSLLYLDNSLIVSDDGSRFFISYWMSQIHSLLFARRLDEICSLLQTWLVCKEPRKSIYPKEFPIDSNIGDNPPAYAGTLQ